MPEDFRKILFDYDFFSPEVFTNENNEVEIIFMQLDENASEITSKWEPEKKDWFINEAMKFMQDIVDKYDIYNKIYDEFHNVPNNNESLSIIKSKVQDYIEQIEQENGHSLAELFYNKLINLNLNEE